VGESLEDDVGVGWRDACSFKGLQYCLFLEGGKSRTPEEREEVAFSDMNKALAALEVVGKLV
jgi:hypothetical protein